MWKRAKAFAAQSSIQIQLFDIAFGIKKVGFCGAFWHRNETFPEVSS